MMVISGPNGSGKTVYMKQTALIIDLAHIGLYVPAQIAEIPLIDKVAIVEANRSIYNNKDISGLQAEMAALGRLTTPGLLSSRSLVLIDELGASVDRSIAERLLATTILFLSDNGKGHIMGN